MQLLGCSTKRRQAQGKQPGQAHRRTLALPARSSFPSAASEPSPSAPPPSLSPAAAAAAAAAPFLPPAAFLPPAPFFLPPAVPAPAASSPPPAAALLHLSHLLTLPVDLPPSVAATAAFARVACCLPTSSALAFWARSFVSSSALLQAGRGRQAGRAGKRRHAIQAVMSAEGQHAGRRRPGRWAGSF
jgi:hypothetical protein